MNTTKSFRNTDRSGSRGRPREFDMDEALDKAILIFREQGYHATSISQLATAMELASGSIYKAFKDKRDVFLAALDRYIEVRNNQLCEKLEAANSGRDRLIALLKFYAESSHDKEGRRGCLVVGSAVELATFDAEIANRVTGALTRNEALVASLIQQGQKDGSISARLASDVTARTILCLLQGMRVVGKTGRSKKQMDAVAYAALKLLD